MNNWPNNLEQVGGGGQGSFSIAILTAEFIVTNK